MKFCVTTRYYQVSNSLWRVIKRHVEKIEQRFPHLNPNLGVIKLVIKRNKRRNYFDGSISLSMPKKHLYVHFLGFYPEEVVDNAFGHLFKELARYKGKHFINDSQYFHHESIRRNYGYQA